MKLNMHKLNENIENLSYNVAEQATIQRKKKIKTERKLFIYQQTF